MIIQTDVVNPVPGLSKVAVVPFFNHSQDPSADGREFAMAYYAKLQKVPGFQVVPIGVTEVAIHAHRLQFADESDAARLAEILDVDAVVIGAITDFNPYYPPRVGMDVTWYTTRQWDFSPPELLDAGDGQSASQGGSVWSERFRQLRGGSKQDCCASNVDPKSPVIVRGQSMEWSPVSSKPNSRSTHQLFAQKANPGRNDGITAASFSEQPQHSSWQPVTNWNPGVTASQFPDRIRLDDDDQFQAVANRDSDTATANSTLDLAQSPTRTLKPIPLQPKPSWEDATRNQLQTPEPDQFDSDPNMDRPIPRVLAIPPPPSDLNETGRLMDAAEEPRRAIPLMAYTRMFDGAESEFTAALRDFLELRGDLRAGGWEGHLYRTDDFVRFAAHLMIVEMLTLHGGEARSRIVLKMRKHR